MVMPVYYQIKQIIEEETGMKKEIKKGRRIGDEVNHEGLMMNNDEHFKYLVSSKAAQEFEKKKHKIKPSRIDAFLTRLYLAL